MQPLWMKSLREHLRPLARPTLLLAVCSALAGCSGAPTVFGPSATVPVTFPALSGPYTIVGRVIGLARGEVVAGATLRFNQNGAVSTVTTGDTGAFELRGASAGVLQFGITRDGYLSRQSQLMVQGNQAGVSLDVVEQSPPFDLTFFRQFARGGFEGPLVSLQPWTEAPRFYIRTVTDDVGEAVDPSVIAGVTRVIHNAVPELSAGRFQRPTIETGEEARPQKSGWVNVIFLSFRLLVPNSPTVTGFSTVGQLPDGGYTLLRYFPPDGSRGRSVYGCGSLTVDTEDHEIVHTMGFRHTAATATDFQSGQGCMGAGRPDRVKYHVAIAYARQPGNLDQDTDPTYVYSLGELTMSSVARFSLVSRSGGIR